MSVVFVAQVSACVFLSAVHIEKIVLKGVQRKRADKYWEYTFKVSHFPTKDAPHAVLRDLWENLGWVC